MKKGRLLIWGLGFLLLIGPACATYKKISKTEPAEIAHEKFLTRIKPESKNGKLKIAIEASDKIQYTVFRLGNPKRLVLDLPGIDASAFTAPIELGAGLASKILATHFMQTGNSRIEIFLNQSVKYEVDRLDDGSIMVRMQPLEGVAVGERAIRKDETEITGLELREMSGLARVVISYRGPKPRFRMIRKMDKNRITLDIFNAKMKKKNEKLLDVTAKDSLVQNVAGFQFATRPRGIVKVLANLNDPTSSNVFQRPGEIILDIGSQAILASASEEPEKEKGVGLTVITGKEKAGDEYTGEKISLDFQDAKVKNILRIIAEVGKINIITSDNVKGKVTLRLVDVPWDLALEIILKNNKLGMSKTGDIVRIATLDELGEESKLLAATKKSGAAAAKLYLKIFQINYESVDKLKTNLDTIKSDRGSIDVNKRSNTLIIQETKEKLSEMERLIEVLDKRTQQVLIEARIVELSSNYARELGVKWGGRYSTSTGASFPKTVGLSGISAAGDASGTAGNLINLPISGAPTAAIGIKLGSVNNTALLDLQLFALQNEGKGRILSMPKIATMNNTEALIESGREIPYQTISQNGTQTQFKKASLSLKVTPHVAQDKFIRLEIDATKDEPDFANALPGAPPPLLTKKAKTEVLVKDSDTTVIGGLFKESTTKSNAGVPFLSKIPVLGWLFKNDIENKAGEELLIFITPKIL